MKKYLIPLFMMILMVLLPVAAIAEEAAGLGELAPYTWSLLATVAGATAATLLIVQFIKAPLDKVGHLPTRILVYIIAVLILGCATAFTSGLTLAEIPLIAVNAFVVALAAMGAYEATFAKTENKNTTN